MSRYADLSRKIERMDAPELMLRASEFLFKAARLADRERRGASTLPARRTATMLRTLCERGEAKRMGEERTRTCMAEAAEALKSMSVEMGRIGAEEISAVGRVLERRCRVFAGETATRARRQPGEGARDARGVAREEAGSRRTARDGAGRERSGQGRSDCGRAWGGAATTGGAGRELVRRPEPDPRFRATEKAYAETAAMLRPEKRPAVSLER